MLDQAIGMPANDSSTNPRDMAEEKKSVIGVKIKWVPC